MAGRAQAVVSEQDANVIRRGGTPVTARVPNRSRTLSRQAAYRQSGWSRFDESASPFTSDRTRPRESETVVESVAPHKSMAKRAIRQSWRPPKGKVSSSIPARQADRHLRRLYRQPHDRDPQEDRRIVAHLDHRFQWRSRFIRVERKGPPGGADCPTSGVPIAWRGMGAIENGDWTHTAFPNGDAQMTCCCVWRGGTAQAANFGS
jgi:hypothetical protein